MAQKNTTASFWQAENYHHNSHLQEGIAKTLLAGSLIKKNDAVLDVGCGDGKITAFIAQHKVPHGSVTGVDLSKSMIDFAQHTFPAKEYGNLRFALSDAADLTFAPTFNFVVSFAALHWVKNQKAALTGINNALLPGGRILLYMASSFPNYRPNSLMKTIDTVAGNKKWEQHFTQLQKPWSYPQHITNYTALLEECHFVHINTDFHAQECLYQDKNDLMNSIEAWLPHAHHLPAALKQDFLEDVVDYHLTHSSNVCVNDDGTITTQARFLLAQAEKKR